MKPIKDSLLTVRCLGKVELSIEDGQVKGSSSHRITHKVGPDAFFKWQGAYEAFTLARSDVARLRHYILNQSKHHREGTIDPDQELPL